jgi:hypothetical protein
MGTESETDLTAQLPKLKFGFWLAALLFCAEMVWGIQKELGRGTLESESAGGYAAAFAVAGSLVATAYVLHCISSYHYVLGQVEGWSHPISPKRAVRFHLIPIFNIYWNYKWPREIAKFVNWRMQTHRMSGALVGTLVLVGVLIAMFFDLSVGLLVIVSTFAYLSRCLRDAFAAPPVPQELHANSGLDAATLSIDP